MVKDPAGFDAGSNFHAFVLNNPIFFVEPTGLQQVGTLPPDPRANTIVCNGHGGRVPHTLVDVWGISRERVGGLL